jgi:hypothetical protein
MHESCRVSKRKRRTFIDYSVVYMASLLPPAPQVYLDRIFASIRDADSITPDAPQPRKAWATFWYRLLAIRIQSFISIRTPRPSPSEQFSHPHEMRNSPHRNTFRSEIENFHRHSDRPERNIVKPFSLNIIIIHRRRRFACKYVKFHKRFWAVEASNFTNFNGAQQVEFTCNKQSIGQVDEAIILALTKID